MLSQTNLLLDDLSCLRKSTLKSLTSKKTRRLIGDSRRSPSTTISKQIPLKNLFRLTKIQKLIIRVGRMILTKRPGADDDVSDADVEDITCLYKTFDHVSRYQRQSDGCFNAHFSNF